MISILNFDPIAPMVRRAIEAGVQTPALLMDAHILAHNLQVFTQVLGLSAQDIYYPVKTNNHPLVLEKMFAMGTHFEIASAGELDMLKAIGVPANKIIFSNPVKMPAHIVEAAAYGVDAYAFDSLNEVERLAAYAPGCRVFLRLHIPNAGAAWTLDRKFGAIPSRALELFQAAIQRGLRPAGVAFHVGWNNPDIQTWLAALENVETVLEQCAAAGISLGFVNLGGGFPAHNVDQYGAFAVISEAISLVLQRFRARYGTAIYAEPGSFLVANAGVMLMRVYNVLLRQGHRWAFVDTGTLQGFVFSMAGIKYHVFSPFESAGRMVSFSVTGPTCDSHDVFGKKIKLPDSLKPDDVLAVFPAGAYVSSAREYNGIGYPEVSLV